MAGWTNRGKADCLSSWVGDGYTLPTTFYLALAKSTPTADTNTFNELTEVATGEGYPTGGNSVPRTGGQWTETEDDGADEGYMVSSDITFTNLAAGGTIPADGVGATYAVVLDDDGTVANREVLHFGSFGGAKVSGTDQDFVVQNLTIKLTE